MGRQHDYINQLNKAAEASALAALRLKLPDWAIEDLAGVHAGWDFGLRHVLSGATLRVDVKCDRYIDTTGRIPFEERIVYADGHVAPGWGKYEKLDLVIVVGAASWRAWAMRLATVRAYIEDTLQATSGKPGVFWRPIARHVPEDGTTAHGWAVPLAELTGWYPCAVVPMGVLPRVPAGA